MPKCAFLTVADQDDWVIDDNLAYTALRELGWELEEVAWDKQDADWNQYDVVAIRSPWDYQHRLAEFVWVLEQIDASRAKLYNSLAMVKWNINKNYLFELEARGIELVPTRRVESPTPEFLRGMFDAFDADRVVIKPTVSANADGTFPFSKESSDAELTEICEFHSGMEGLVQPFMSAIVEEGEFSLIYFNGQFSHAIIKTVKQGDFRVQEEHGGGVVPLPNPDAKLIETADKVIAAAPEVPLYGRVDLVRTPADTFALMELELIEPSLYFRFGENSAAAFANAFADRYSSS